MKLRVNGEDFETGAETLTGLIEQLNLKPEGVAVEVNLNVIKKKDYGETRLREGDAVEIVKFVGGG